MQLDSKDINAVARSRTLRSLPNKVKAWMYIGAVISLLSLLYGFQGDKWLSFGGVIAGIGMIWYYGSLVDKLTKRLSAQLKDELASEEGVE